MITFHSHKLPPLFVLAIAQILGIAGSYSCSLPTLFCATIFFLTPLAIFLFVKKYDWEYVLFPLAIAGGASLYLSQKASYHCFLASVSNRPLVMKGTIVDYSATEKKYAPWCLQVKATLLEQGIPIAYNKHILIYTSIDGNIHPGDKIIVNQCCIKSVVDSDYLRYLIKENIAATLFVSKENIQIIPQPGSVYRTLVTTRNRILESMQQSLDSSTFYMFSSLFLGNKNSTSQEKDTINDHFKTWGISHYLARSGLHLIIFVWIWHVIFKYIPIPFIVKQLIQLFICFLYAFFTWSSVSFLRALWTFVLCKLYAISKKSFNFINLLSLISLSFLTYNPSQLFFLDFQLSFILTFALAWHNALARIIK